METNVDEILASIQNDGVDLGFTADESQFQSRKVSQLEKSTIEEKYTEKYQEFLQKSPNCRLQNQVTGANEDNVFDESLE